ncbi:MAG: monovalent cation/H+ antiporter complex subunit F [Ignisphaera sp.]|uniref:pH regulation protein F n=1 Tax=Ignisphaera aggregans TaxID=334771 RepID=A0A7C4JJR7_9CREN
MSVDIKTWVDIFLTICMAPYIASFLLYLVRVVKGPTIPDRVIAVDALGFDLAAFLVILSILFESPILLVCAMVLSLWVFALDIYVAKYLESKELGE